MASIETQLTVVWMHFETPCRKCPIRFAECLCHGRSAVFRREDGYQHRTPKPIRMFDESEPRAHGTRQDGVPGTYGRVPRSRVAYAGGEPTTAIPVRK